MSKPTASGKPAWTAGLPTLDKVTALVCTFGGGSISSTVQKLQSGDAASKRQCSPRTFLAAQRLQGKKRTFTVPIKVMQQLYALTGGFAMSIWETNTSRVQGQAISPYLDGYSKVHVGNAGFELYLDKEERPRAWLHYQNFWLQTTFSRQWVNLPKVIALRDAGELIQPPAPAVGEEPMLICENNGVLVNRMHKKLGFEEHRHGYDKYKYMEKEYIREPLELNCFSEPLSSKESLLREMEEELSGLPNLPGSGLPPLAPELITKALNSR